MTYFLHFLQKSSIYYTQRNHFLILISEICWVSILSSFNLISNGRPCMVANLSARSWAESHSKTLMRSDLPGQMLTST